VLRFKSARGSISSGRRRKASHCQSTDLPHARSCLLRPRARQNRQQARRQAHRLAPRVRPGPTKLAGLARAKARAPATHRTRLPGRHRHSSNGKRHAKAPWREHARHPTDPRTHHARLTLIGRHWRDRPAARNNYCRASLRSGYERRRRRVPEWGRLNIGSPNRAARVAIFSRLPQRRSYFRQASRCDLTFRFRARH